MSTASTALLLDQLAILSLSPSCPPDLPRPPADLLPNALPFNTSTPSSTLIAFRDHLLHVLSAFLGSDPSRSLDLLRPVRFPTQVENAHFVGVGASWISEVRKKGLENEEEAGWWREIKGGVRKSDLLQAKGVRYEELLLALSTTVVWAEIQKTIPSGQRHIHLPSTAQEAKEQLPHLLANYERIASEASRLAKPSLTQLNEIVERWEAVGQINASLTQGVQSQDPVTIERLHALREMRLSRLEDMIREWCEMNGSKEGEGQAILRTILSGLWNGEAPDPKESHTAQNDRLPTSRFPTHEASHPSSLSSLPSQLEALQALFQEIPLRLSEAEAMALNPDSERKASSGRLAETGGGSNRTGQDALMEGWKGRLESSRKELEKATWKRKTEVIAGHKENGLSLWIPPSTFQYPPIILPPHLSPLLDPLPSISTSERVRQIRQSLREPHSASPSSAFATSQPTEGLSLPSLPSSFSFSPHLNRLGDSAPPPPSRSAIKELLLPVPSGSYLPVPRKAKPEPGRPPQTLLLDSSSSPRPPINNLPPSPAPRASPLPKPRPSKPSERTSEKQNASRRPNKGVGVVVGTGRRTLSRIAMERAELGTMGKSLTETKKKRRGGRQSVIGAFDGPSFGEDDDPFGEKVLDYLVSSTGSPALDTPPRPSRRRSSAMHEERSTQTGLAPMSSTPSKKVSAPAYIRDPLLSPMPPLPGMGGGGGGVGLGVRKSPWRMGMIRGRGGKRVGEADDNEDEWVISEGEDLLDGEDGLDEIMAAPNESFSFST